MTSHSYRDAGVDVEAGNALVSRIKPLARATRRPGAEAALGGFGALFDPKAAGYRDPLLVSTTDGVGTKLRLAIETGRHRSIGIDLVAMCVNDLLAEGAEPLFFLDYFATGRLDAEIAESVIAGIADGCRASGCALIGGETAEMPGLYGDGDYDLAGFAVGAVERGEQLSARRVEPGDVLVGLASDGVHSNGFSLVRRLVAVSGLAWDDPAPFSNETTLGEALLTPTRLYVRPALAVLRGDSGAAIRGAAHITGGGLPDNVARILPEAAEAAIDAATWEVPPVFRWLQRTGSVDAGEMYRTFNCGLGMVLACDPAGADAVIAGLREAGEQAWRIGVVRPRGGPDAVTIRSAEVPWRG